MIKRMINWFRSNRLYVIADMTDSSVTVSKKLYKAMGVEDADCIRIFVFKAGNEFGFSVNWEETECEDMPYSNLQYNSKHKTIGFETLNPTVAKMFYDYNIPSDITKCKLSVSIEDANGRSYFKIHKPCVI